MEKFSNLTYDAALSTAIQHVLQNNNYQISTEGVLVKKGNPGPAKQDPIVGQLISTLLSSVNYSNKAYRDYLGINTPKDNGTFKVNPNEFMANLCGRYDVDYSNSLDNAYMLNIMVAIVNKINAVLSKRSVGNSIVTGGAYLEKEFDTINKEMRNNESLKSKIANIDVPTAENFDDVKKLVDTLNSIADLITNFKLDDIDMTAENLERLNKFFIKFYKLSDANKAAFYILAVNRINDIEIHHSRLALKSTLDQLANEAKNFPLVERFYGYIVTVRNTIENALNTAPDAVKIGYVKVDKNYASVLYSKPSVKDFLSRLSEAPFMRHLPKFTEAVDLVRNKVSKYQSVIYKDYTRKDSTNPNYDQLVGKTTAVTINNLMKDRAALLNLLAGFSESKFNNINVEELEKRDYVDLNYPIIQFTDNNGVLHKVNRVFARLPSDPTDDKHRDARCHDLAAFNAAQDGDHNHITDPRPSISGLARDKMIETYIDRITKIYDNTVAMIRMAESIDSILKTFVTKQKISPKNPTMKDCINKLRYSAITSSKDDTVVSSCIDVFDPSNLFSSNNNGGYATYADLNPMVDLIANRIIDTDQPYNNNDPNVLNYVVDDRIDNSTALSKFNKIQTAFSQQNLLPNILSAFITMLSINGIDVGSADAKRWIDTLRQFSSVNMYEFAYTQPRYSGDINNKYRALMATVFKSTDDGYAFNILDTNVRMNLIKVNEVGDSDSSFNGVGHTTFITVYKAIISAVLTGLDIIDMNHYTNANKFRANVINTSRLIVGAGWTEETQVIPEAVKMYFRLPLLAEFYKKLFATTSKLDSVISLVPTTIPEPFRDLFTVLVYPNADSGEEAGSKSVLDFNNAEIDRTITAVNKVYKKYKGEADEKKLDVCMLSVYKMVDAFNEAYGILDQVTHERLIEHIVSSNLETLPKPGDTSTYVDVDFVNTLLAELPEVGTTTVNPSDKYLDNIKKLSDQLSADKKPKTATNIKIFNNHIDALSRNKQHVADFIRIIYSMLRTVVTEEVPFNITDSRESLSIIDEKLTNLYQRVQNAPTNKEKLEEIYSMFKNATEINPSVTAKLFEYHDCISNGVTSVETVLEMLEDFRDRFSTEIITKNHSKFCFSKDYDNITAKTHNEGVKRKFFGTRHSNSNLLRMPGTLEGMSNFFAGVLTESESAGSLLMSDGVGSIGGSTHIDFAYHSIGGMNENIKRSCTSSSFADLSACLNDVPHTYQLTPEDGYIKMSLTSIRNSDASAGISHFTHALFRHDHYGDDLLNGEKDDAFFEDMCTESLVDIVGRYSRYAHLPLGFNDEINCYDSAEKVDASFNTIIDFTNSINKARNIIIDETNVNNLNIGRLMKKYYNYYNIRDSYAAMVKQDFFSVLRKIMQHPHLYSIVSRSNTNTPRFSFDFTPASRIIDVAIKSLTTYKNTNSTGIKEVDDKINAIVANLNARLDDLFPRNIRNNAMNKAVETASAFLSNDVNFFRAHVNDVFDKFLAKSGVEWRRLLNHAAHNTITLIEPEMIAQLHVREKCVTRLSELCQEFWSTFTISRSHNLINRSRNISAICNEPNSIIDSTNPSLATLNNYKLVNLLERNTNKAQLHEKALLYASNYVADNKSTSPTIDLSNLILAEPNPECFDASGIFQNDLVSWLNNTINVMIKEMFNSEDKRIYIDLFNCIHDVPTIENNITNIAYIRYLACGIDYTDNYATSEDYSSKFNLLNPSIFNHNHMFNKGAVTVNITPYSNSTTFVKAGGISERYLSEFMNESTYRADDYRGLQRAVHSPVRQISFPESTMIAAVTKHDKSSMSHVDMKKNYLMHGTDTSYTIENLKNITTSNGLNTSVYKPNTIIMMSNISDKVPPSVENEYISRTMLVFDSASCRWLPDHIILGNHTPADPRTNNDAYVAYETHYNTLENSEYSTVGKSRKIGTCYNPLATYRDILGAKGDKAANETQPDYHRMKFSTDDSGNGIKYSPMYDSWTELFQRSGDISKMKIKMTSNESMNFTDLMSDYTEKINDTIANIIKLNNIAKCNVTNEKYHLLIKSLEKSELQTVRFNGRAFEIGSDLYSLFVNKNNIPVVDDDACKNRMASLVKHDEINHYNRADNAFSVVTHRVPVVGGVPPVPFREFDAIFKIRNNDPLSIPSAIKACYVKYLVMNIYRSSPEESARNEAARYSDMLTSLVLSINDRTIFDAVLETGNYEVSREVLAHVNNVLGAPTDRLRPTNDDNWSFAIQVADRVMVIHVIDINEQLPPGARNAYGSVINSVKNWFTRYTEDRAEGVPGLYDLSDVTDAASAMNIINNDSDVLSVIRSFKLDTANIIPNTQTLTHDVITNINSVYNACIFCLDIMIKDYDYATKLAAIATLMAYNVLNVDILLPETVLDTDRCKLLLALSSIVPGYNYAAKNKLNNFFGDAYLHREIRPKDCTLAASVAKGAITLDNAVRTVIGNEIAMIHSVTHNSAPEYNNNLITLGLISSITNNTFERCVQLSSLPHLIKKLPYCPVPINHVPDYAALYNNSNMLLKTSPDANIVPRTAAIDVSIQNTNIANDYTINVMSFIGNYSSDHLRAIEEPHVFKVCKINTDGIFSPAGASHIVNVNIAYNNRYGPERLAVTNNISIIATLFRTMRSFNSGNDPNNTTNSTTLRYIAETGRLELGRPPRTINEAPVSNLIVDVAKNTVPRRYTVRKYTDLEREGSLYENVNQRSAVLTLDKGIKANITSFNDMYRNDDIKSLLSRSYLSGNSTIIRNSMNPNTDLTSRYVGALANAEIAMLSNYRAFSSANSVQNVSCNATASPSFVPLNVNDHIHGDTHGSYSRLYVGGALTKHNLYDYMSNNVRNELYQKHSRLFPIALGSIINDAYMVSCEERDKITHHNHNHLSVTLKESNPNGIILKSIATIISSLKKCTTDETKRSNLMYEYVPYRSIADMSDKAKTKLIAACTYAKYYLTIISKLCEIYSYTPFKNNNPQQSVIISDTNDITTKLLKAIEETENATTIYNTAVEKKYEVEDNIYNKSKTANLHNYMCDGATIPCTYKYNEANLQITKYPEAGTVLNTNSIISCIRSGAKTLNDVVSLSLKEMVCDMDQSIFYSVFNGYNHTPLCNYSSVIRELPTNIIGFTNTIPEPVRDLGGADENFDTVEAGMMSHNNILLALSPMRVTYEDPALTKRRVCGTYLVMDQMDPHRVLDYTSDALGYPAITYSLYNKRGHNSIALPVKGLSNPWDLRHKSISELFLVNKSMYDALNVIIKNNRTVTIDNIDAVSLATINSAIINIKCSPNVNPLIHRMSAMSDPCKESLLTCSNIPVDCSLLANSMIGKFMEHKDGTNTILKYYPTLKSMYHLGATMHSRHREVELAYIKQLTEIIRYFLGEIAVQSIEKKFKLNEIDFFKDIDRLIKYNIIDLNVMPIDINALSREIPLIHLITFSTALDEYVLDNTGGAYIGKVYNTDMDDAFRTRFYDELGNVYGSEVGNLRKFPDSLVAVPSKIKADLISSFKNKAAGAPLATHNVYTSLRYNDMYRMIENPYIDINPATNTPVIITETAHNTIEYLYPYHITKTVNGDGVYPPMNSLKGFANSVTTTHNEYDRYKLTTIPSLDTVNVLDEFLNRKVKYFADHNVVISNNMRDYVNINDNTAVPNVAAEQNILPEFIVRQKNPGFSNIFLPVGAVSTLEDKRNLRDLVVLAKLLNTPDAFDYAVVRNLMMFNLLHNFIRIKLVKSANINNTIELKDMNTLVIDNQYDKLIKDKTEKYPRTDVINVNLVM